MFKKKNAIYISIIAFLFLLIVILFIIVINLTITIKRPTSSAKNNSLYEQYDQYNIKPREAMYYE